MTAAAVDEVHGGWRVAGRPVGDYSAEARRIMAEHPSVLGWQKRDLRPCGGRHPRTPGAGPMVLWRRSRDYYHPDTCRAYDIAEDPPLWVAEQLSTGLCVSEHWVWRIRTVLEDFPLAAADLGLPWHIDDGARRPGFTVRLEVANGQWLWRVTGEPGPVLRGLSGEVA